MGSNNCCGREAVTGRLVWGGGQAPRLEYVYRLGHGADLVRSVTGRDDHLAVSRGLD